MQGGLTRHRRALRPHLALGQANPPPQLLTRAEALVRLLVLLDAIGIAVAGAARYRAGLTHFYDLGVFDNIIWQTLHGRLFFYPQYEMSFFGDHFAPILFLVVPVYLVVQHPIALVVVQSLALALGAIPLSHLARALLSRGEPRGAFASVFAREAAVVAVVVLYLGNIALLHISMFDFHPIAFAIPLSLAVYQAALEERWPRFWLMSALVLACQEETAITMAALGVSLALIGQGVALRRRGAALALVATVYFVVVMKVVIPAFQRPVAQAGWVYVTRYAHLGSTPGEVLRTLVLHPLEAIGLSYAPYKLETLWQLFLPLGLLPLLGWRTFLVAIPSIFYNYLSSRDHQFRIQFQYSSSALPWLFVSAAAGLRTWAGVVERVLGRVAGRRRLALACTLLPLGLAGGSSAYYYATLKPIRASFFASWPYWPQIDEVRRIVGPDASLSATNNLGPFFSERREIYLSLDFTHNRDLVRVLGLPDYHDSKFHLFDLTDFNSSADCETRVLNLFRDDRYGMRYANGPILLFERGFPPRRSSEVEDILLERARLRAEKAAEVAK